MIIKLKKTTAAVAVIFCAMLKVKILYKKSYKLYNIANLFYNYTPAVPLLSDNQ